jgi:hypothetical protein
MHNTDRSYAATARSEPTRYAIQLHIQELVLHGFAPPERYTVAAAVERELGRLFAEEGTPPGMADSTEIPRLVGGSFDVQPEAGPDAIGIQVAREVYRGLRGLHANQVSGSKAR